MKSKEDIRPVSYVKAHTAEILHQVNDTRRPVYVTQNGETKAVVMDTESFENMKNALGILKLISIGEKDIASKKYKPQEDVFNNIEKKLLAKKKKNARKI